MTGRHVLVVGGGIAGLSAALRLADSGEPGLRVTVVEQARRLGGKMHTAQFAGRAVETGAETFLARRPEAVDLVGRVGLADDLVHPRSVPAGLFVGGGLRDLPRGTVMGIPTGADSVAGVLTEAGRARIGRETGSGEPLLAPGADVSVGDLVRDRYGDEVNRRLVDPLLGGVYAGRAADLSLEVAIPQLAEAARHEETLAAAVTRCLSAARPSGSPAPVFGSVSGGLSTLVEAVADASGATIRRGLPVRELHRTGAGWRAVLGPTRDPETLDADWVVLAVPARPAARLLEAVSPAASAAIGRLDYASVGLVTLALPTTDLPDRSGFLVPTDAALTIKAGTFFGRKWQRLDDDRLSIVRVSIGRYGDVAVLQRDDADLIRLAHDDLSTVLGSGLPRPVESVVHRWGGGLPQYAPGHRDRIRSARGELETQPISLAGAAFDGVGIPACVKSGTDAADRAIAAGPPRV